MEMFNEKYLVKRAAHIQYGSQEKWSWAYVALGHRNVQSSP